MTVVKKLIFAPLFIISFAILIWQLPSFLNSYDLLLSFSLNTLLQLLTLSSLILLTAMLFVLFASLAFDWKFVIPVGLITSPIPMLFLPPDLAIILGVAMLASLLIIYVSLENTLNSYVNFEPSALFGPSIRHLSTLLILILCLIYFLSVNQKVQKEGFQIPDALIDEALKFVPQKELQTPQTQQTSTTEASITPEQLELLKKNPDLLRQYGLDPKILDTINLPQSTQENTQPQPVLNETIKQAVKDQLQTIIDPYINFIPAVLAVLLFFVLISITSFLTIFIYPLLWILFKILERTGFIKFTTEMRSVKKMVF
ncbi:hypothetical protein HYT18_00755 [Candidatus Microgenomates bacterium]|nr:hypothetical protein [Candidatus Microgenomates bacterium]